MNVRDVYKIAVDAKSRIRAVRSAIDAELNKIFERIKKRLNSVSLKLMLY